MLSGFNSFMLDNHRCFVSTEALTLHAYKYNNEPSAEICVFEICRFGIILVSFN